MDTEIKMSEILEIIRDGLIGRDRAIDGPFGPRRVIYADYTASGRSLELIEDRSLELIEDFIRSEVMPLYANTHTETSMTGLQTTHFREEARQIILDSVGGSPDDVLIFAGSGATGAIQKLIQILNIRIPADLDEQYSLSSHIPAAMRPVVFIGPYEHHSNELSWRESIAEVIEIPEDHDGRIDIEILEEQLRTYADRPLKIGSFSAASNVTGIVSRTHEITSLLHRHGALSFWDFAAAAPYVGISMNPHLSSDADPSTAKDAIFISPHKFVGGPGTPGVLVVKRKLLRNRVPSVPGGGTVSYVSERGHTYISDPSHREEGGTPAIIESIRAGLVFQLKKLVGCENIEALEKELVGRAIRRWSANPRIHILGSLTATRLSIVSFLIRHRQRYLHHNFVVALLNDLFGIQARGGCSCAGPYGHRLLGIDGDRSALFQLAINAGCEGIKPGWVRVNLNYFCSEIEADYIIQAIEFIADEGWKLLPFYDFHAETGIWHHVDREIQPVLRLADLRLENGAFTSGVEHLRAGEEKLPFYLRRAREIVDALDMASLSGNPIPPLAPELEELRWFTLPSEVIDEEKSM